MVHAEANAILNSTVTDLKGCRIYVALFPCNECTKQIVQKGIGEIIFLEDKYPDSPEGVASRRIMAAAGVTTRQAVLPNLKHELHRVSTVLPT